MFTNGLYGVYSTVDKVARGARNQPAIPGSLAGSGQPLLEPEKQDLRRKTPRSPTSRKPCAPAWPSN